MYNLYFDHNATTPLLPEVIEEMRRYMEHDFMNPSSPHRAAQDLRALLEQRRQDALRRLGAKTGFLLFTGSGSEANNLAFNGKTGHVVTSRIEHHSVLNPLLNPVLNDDFAGFGVDFVPCDGNGIIDPGDVKKAVRENTVLISIQAANNEMGAVQPLTEIGRWAREKGILFHTDAAQAVGKYPVAIDELNADLVSFSGHKFYGPKGTGGLYVRELKMIRAQVLGGAQEHSLRAGTENTYGIMGLCKALELALADMPIEAERLRSLRDRFEDMLLLSVGDARINGHSAPSVNRLCNTSSVTVPGVPAAALIQELDLKGMSVSALSACDSGSEKPSHVLKAIGLPDAEARCTFRVSLGRNNRREDIDALVIAIAGIVKKLRADGTGKQESDCCGGKCC
jgi:cysteine desulfurase